MNNDYRDILIDELETELDFYITNKIEKEIEEKEKWLSISDVSDVIYEVIDRWKKRAEIKSITESGL